MSLLWRAKIKHPEKELVGRVIGLDHIDSKLYVEWPDGTLTKIARQDLQFEEKNLAYEPSPDEGSISYF